jgi:hypothetical protein
MEILSLKNERPRSKKNSSPDAGSKETLGMMQF